MTTSAIQGPVGLALSGGGAHGAWQAGAARALSDAGVPVAEVIGFSAGALTGAGYALGILDILAERWRTVDSQRILRFAPKLKPFSLFSDEPIRDAVQYTADDEGCKGRLKCNLTVVSLKVPQGEQDYARFTPAASGGWDGPLAVKLMASCAIPGVFPSVVHQADGAPPQRLIDGGVPGKDWMRFDVLAGCAAVIALQMTRPEEVGRFRLWPWDRFDQTGREICARHMNSGLESVFGRARPPKVYRLCPSRLLSFSQLSFKSSLCVPAMELGYEDARRFLADPEPYAIGPADLAPASSPVPAPGRPATA